MKTVATALCLGASLFLSSLVVIPPALAQQDEFNAADANGDGALSMEEITAVAKTTTAENYAAVDLNGDGTLQYDEFEIGVEEGFIVLD